MTRQLVFVTERFALPHQLIGFLVFSLQYIHLTDAVVLTACGRHRPHSGSAGLTMTTSGCLAAISKPSEPETRRCGSTLASRSGSALETGESATAVTGLTSHSSLQLLKIPGGAV